MSCQRVRWPWPGATRTRHCLRGVRKSGLRGSCRARWNSRMSSSRKAVSSVRRLMHLMAVVPRRASTTLPNEPLPSCRPSPSSWRTSSSGPAHTVLAAHAGQVCARSRAQQLLVVEHRGAPGWPIRFESAPAQLLVKPQANLAAHLYAQAVLPQQASQRPNGHHAPRRPPRLGALGAVLRRQGRELLLILLRVAVLAVARRLVAHRTFAAFPRSRRCACAFEPARNACWALVSERANREQRRTFCSSLSSSRSRPPPRLIKNAGRQAELHRAPGSRFARQRPRAGAGHHQEGCVVTESLLANWEQEALPVQWGQVARDASSPSERDPPGHTHAGLRRRRQVQEELSLITSHSHQQRAQQQAS